MFAIFSLIGSATILVVERKTHTLQRMLTTSMRRALGLHHRAAAC